MDKYFFGYYFFNGRIFRESWMDEVVNHNIHIKKRPITEEEFNDPLALLEARYPFNSIGWA